MTRRVEGLIWALRGGPPRGLPVKRPRGAKAAGVRYEKALAQALPIGDHGVWWNFCDSRGPGWCQTDVLLRGASRELVLEAKYTYTEDAWEQLEGLYGPVVEKALGREVIGIQVCKRFLGTPPRGVSVAGTLAEAIGLANRRLRVVLHWIGPLAPPLWPVVRRPLESPGPLPATSRKIEA